MPLPARIMLVLAVVALGIAIVFAGRGGLAQVVGAIGQAFSGFVDAVTATPAPSPSPSPLLLDTPTLTAPAEAYTNAPTVDITGSIPAQFVGLTDHRIRLYVTLKDQAPAPIAEQAVADRASFLFPGVSLTKGTNEFGATLLGPDDTESEVSTPIVYIFDTSKPKITLSAPKDGDTVNGNTVQIAGKTQGRSTIVARNEANNASATTTVLADGTFALTLALASGTNGIQITATDPAGNQGSLILSVSRGSGKLAARLTASAYRFRVDRLPAEITLTVVVTDPDGHPVEGALVTFTLSIPGIQVVTADGTTGGDGTATFTTTIPVGATAGTGPGTALVETAEFGTVTSRTAITIIQ